ncbi:site-specific integrase [Asticcacaulis sp. BYS171W]|uniref:Site-specific integrase n=1 Tax=Asticcacaulis aquaticus TaxID=2984212 RepID=A0ABT5HWC0_9CAUL|nr:site-specific integrase [Asticcacaulis aquaticus]
MPGFGLRFRANGTKRWITRFFERGKARTVTLGAVAEMPAKEARLAAQQRLKQLALIGLPKKPAHNQSKAQTTVFAALVDTFLEDRPFAWKPRTEKRHIACIRSAILPQFGERCVEGLRREDVMRWRDTRIGNTKCFNIEIAVLSALFEYAEKLGIRKIDTNPARGIPRLKQTIRERFLTLPEYRRLFQRLDECDDQLRANSIRLLLHTGARHMEIGGLRWGHVSSGRLEIPDSKTGPKTILLSRQAQGILASLPRGDDHDLVFSPNGRTPAYLGKFWMNFRSRAGLPDVRLHDLRHSYASIAVQNGINLAHVGRLLGHALPETMNRPGFAGGSLV